MTRYQQEQIGATPSGTLPPSQVYPSLNPLSHRSSSSRRCSSLFNLRVAEEHDHFVLEICGRYVIVAIEKHLEEFKVEGASVLSSTVQLCETDLKPDVAIYDKDSGCKDKKRIDFSALDMWVEFKKSSLFDPFDDDEGTPFERDTINGKSTRGQMTAYATARLGTHWCYRYQGL
ncbi:hypothetical protein J3A83DRAFT_4219672 [Scleroderma citrinum]